MITELYENTFVNRFIFRYSLLWYIMPDILYLVWSFFFFFLFYCNFWLNLKSFYPVTLDMYFDLMSNKNIYDYYYYYYYYNICFVNICFVNFSFSLSYFERICCILTYIYTLHYFTLEISFTVLITVCHIILMMLVQRIWYWIN